MKIEVFANLKEYFEKQFQVTQKIENISSLKHYLMDKNPQAADALRSCRFAVEDEFVGDNYQLKDNDTISIIPPSSGG